MAAKLAAQAALKEASPSRVGREIGGYFSKGIALGIVEPKQIAAIRNASRFIGTTMTESNYNSISNDNRKTYHQNQSVTVNVDSLAVRDQQDVYALALEIDALKRRIFRGKGG